MNNIRSLLLLIGLYFPLIIHAKDAPLLCHSQNKLSIWSPLKSIQFGSMDIKADNVELFGTQSAEFSGDVDINTAKLNIKASSALLDKQLGLFNATGPISYQDVISKIKSTGLNADLSNSQINLLGAEYQLTQQQARGAAEQLSINKSEFTLNNGSFTTCPIDNEFWSIHADKIILSQEEGWGETHGMTLKVLDTPILYLPYFTYPISDKRQSGFLIPSFGPSSKYGFEIETPFYWNIAENIDATITPRYMANQGVQLKTELRYLTKQHQGSIGIEYLNEDKSEPELNERYLFNWQQVTNFNKDWRASIDVTNVSDDNYLTDLKSNFANKTDTQLYRTGLLTHFGDMWQTDIKIQSFEVLGAHSASYSALPQITFDQIHPFNWHDILFTLKGELSHFKNTKLKIPEASRVHIEPKAQYSYQDFGWSFSSELSLLQTNYQQTGNFEGTNIEKKVSRTLPKLRLHSQINLERKTPWLVKNGYQVLEPQIQYLYVPKKDQTNIGLYDTTKLQDDFFGLFRDKRFSGVDRIAAANQFTVGATTRIFGEKNNELFNLSAGQTFYLSDSAKPTEQELGEQKTYNSLFAGEAMLHWHKRWYLGTGIQYDVEGKELVQSHITLDYKGSNNQLIQLNHRFANDVSVSENRIEQMGAFTSIPISDNWQFIASYQRDLEHNRSVEILSGLQYESCCWAIQFTGHRQIETDLNQSDSEFGQQDAVFNSGFRLDFVLKGLGGKSNYDAKKLLQQGIFGYRRPYFINN